MAELSRLLDYDKAALIKGPFDSELVRVGTHDLADLGSNRQGLLVAPAGSMAVMKEVASEIAAEGGMGLAEVGELPDAIYRRKAEVAGISPDELIDDAVNNGYEVQSIGGYHVPIVRFLERVAERGIVVPDPDDYLDDTAA
jgi:hypothetical protein